MPARKPASTGRLAPVTPLLSDPISQAMARPTSIGLGLKKVYRPGITNLFKLERSKHQACSQSLLIASPDQRARSSSLSGLISFPDAAVMQGFLLFSALLLPLPWQCRVTMTCQRSQWQAPSLCGTSQYQNERCRIPCTESAIV